MGTKHICSVVDSLLDGNRCHSLNQNLYLFYDLMENNNKNKNLAKRYTKYLGGNVL